MSHVEILPDTARIQVFKAEIERLRELLLDAERRAIMYEAYYVATLNKQGFPLRRRAEEIRAAKARIEASRI